MKKIKMRGIFLASAVTAVALGGSMAVVMASVPDSGGVIHACYRNVSGALRIIDPTVKHCGLKETAIAWSQQGPMGPQGPAGTNSTTDDSSKSDMSTAYAHLTGGPNNGVWDKDRSKDITDVAFSYFSPQGQHVACLTVAFEPKDVSITGGSVLPDMAGVRNTGLNPENNGWSDAFGNEACGATGNAFVAGYGRSTFLTFTR